MAYLRGHLLLISLCSVLLQTAALSFQYDFSIPGVLNRANLLYLNDSFGDGDKISLTKMANGSAGRVAYKQPVRLWDCRNGNAASFTTSFSFAIDGIHNNTRGDGLAFFVGPFPPILPVDSLAGFPWALQQPGSLGLAADRGRGVRHLQRNFCTKSCVRRPMTSPRIGCSARGCSGKCTEGQLHHRNLVKLVGWCGSDDSDTLLLVYELIVNRSVDRHLHGPERLLTWPERYKIVLGVGYAIEYLHTGCPNPILHRDIKPSNVMLDGDYVPKLGDFGLVRQVPGQGHSLAGTDMVGSNEYIDPVCISNNTATTASDMYSFRVLLLEIATGKNPAASREEVGVQNALVSAVRDSYARSRGAVLQMADERLNGNFDEWQLERVLVVGLLCVQPGRRDRPKIRDAVYMMSNFGHPVPRLRF
ncbi:unnamed protein product [Urochloa decumbens]|uniref:Protein kinase domain-containing protein n=1 Tax=Urochloa decumbens TaxID=240449 RepID=A0ABC8YPK3_9POAL